MSSSAFLRRRNGSAMDVNLDRVANSAQIVEGLSVNEIVSSRRIPWSQQSRREMTRFAAVLSLSTSSIKDVELAPLIRALRVQGHPKIAMISTKIRSALQHLVRTRLALRQESTDWGWEAEWPAWTEVFKTDDWNGDMHPTQTQSSAGGVDAGQRRSARLADNDTIDGRAPPQQGNDHASRKSTKGKEARKVRFADVAAPHTSATKSRSSFLQQRRPASLSSKHNSKSEEFGGARAQTTSSASESEPEVSTRKSRSSPKSKSTSKSMSKSKSKHTPQSSSESDSQSEAPARKSLPFSEWRSRHTPQPTSESESEVPAPKSKPSSKSRSRRTLQSSSESRSKSESGGPAPKSRPSSKSKPTYPPQIISESGSEAEAPARKSRPSPKPKSRYTPQSVTESESESESQSESQSGSQSESPTWKSRPSPNLRRTPQAFSQTDADTVVRKPESSLKSKRTPEPASDSEIDMPIVEKGSSSKSRSKLRKPEATKTATSFDVRPGAEAKRDGKSRAGSSRRRPEFDEHNVSDYATSLEEIIDDFEFPEDDEEMVFAFGKERASRGG